MVGLTFILYLIGSWHAKGQRPLILKYPSKLSVLWGQQIEEQVPLKPLSTSCKAPYVELEWSQKVYEETPAEVVLHDYHLEEESRGGGEKKEKYKLQKIRKHKICFKYKNYTILKKYIKNYSLRRIK